MVSSGRLAGFVDHRRFFPLVNTSAKGFGHVSDGKLNPSRSIYSVTNAVDLLVFSFALLANI